MSVYIIIDNPTEQGYLYLEYRSGYDVFMDIKAYEWLHTELGTRTEIILPNMKRLSAGRLKRRKTLTQIAEDSVDGNFYYFDGLSWSKLQFDDRVWSNIETAQKKRFSYLPQEDLLDYVTTVYNCEIVPPPVEMVYVGDIVVVYNPHLETAHVIRVKKVLRMIYPEGEHEFIGVEVEFETLISDNLVHHPPKIPKSTQTILFSKIVSAYPKRSNSLFSVNFLIYRKED